LVVVIAAVIMVAGIAGALIGASVVTRQWPPVLEWFAVAVAGLVVVAFLVPDNFYYHYAAFLGPFLAMAFALPAARLIDNVGHADKGLQSGQGSRSRPRWPPSAAWLRRAAIGVAALTIVALPIAVPKAENSPSPTFRVAIAEVTQVILP